MFLCTFSELGMLFAQVKTNELTSSKETVYTEKPQLLSGLSVGVSPVGFLPLGADANIFSFGGGADGLFYSRIAALPPLFVGAGAGYLYLPSVIPNSSVSAGHIAALTGWNFQFSRTVSARLYGEAGWFFAALNGGGAAPGSNPFTSTGLSFGFDPTKTIGLGLDVGYRYYSGLSSGLSLGLLVKFKTEPKNAASGTNLKIPGLQLLKGDNSGLDPVAIRLDTVFPVFYAFYDTNPVGTLYLKNVESADAKNIVVKVLVKQFMDEPKASASLDRLAPGATAAININGLFSDRLLSIAEGTKVPVSVVVEYSQFGTIMKDEFVETLTIEDRNALVWDDDRKAAAFVSSKDPESLRLSRLISASIGGAILPGMNDNLQKAIAVHETVRLLKLNYQKDPSSAISTGNRTSVDFLQFPQQTLAYRTGDCDDLSILYASIFESLGIPAAFITIPGHILVAVDLGITQDQAIKTFEKPADLIVSGGTVWLPIETTALDKNFTGAWEEGARQWRIGAAKNGAKLIPIREAWTTYPAVVLPGTPVQVAFPSAKTITSGFEAETQVVIAHETNARIASLQAEAKKSNSPVPLNKLGVLLARFGQMDKAKIQFTASLKRSETPSALYNLGNLAFSNGDFTESLSWYEKALKKNGSDAKIVIAIARAQSELGHLEDAKTSFEKAKTIDPAVAEQYAYLGIASNEIGRASSSGNSRRNIEWNEEN